MNFEIDLQPAAFRGLLPCGYRVYRDDEVFIAGVVTLLTMDVMRAGETAIEYATMVKRVRHAPGRNTGIWCAYSLCGRRHTLPVALNGVAFVFLATQFVDENGRRGVFELLKENEEQRPPLHMHWLDEPFRPGTHVLRVLPPSSRSFAYRKATMKKTFVA